MHDLSVPLDPNTDSALPHIDPRADTERLKRPASERTTQRTKVPAPEPSDAVKVIVKLSEVRFELEEAKATIQRQSGIIAALTADLATERRRCESMAERLHRYEVQGESPRTHAPTQSRPVVKGGQGRPDDMDGSGGSLVGTLIVAGIAMVVGFAIGALAFLRRGAP